MKRIISVLMVLSITLLMSGCSSVTEINKRAIVQVIGIDKENEAYRISMQIYAPSGKKIEEDSGGAEVNIVTGSGASVFSAIKDVELKQGKSIFFGHNLLIFLGEGTRSDDISAILEYFTKEEVIYPGIDVVMTDKKASDFIEMKLSSGIVSSKVMDSIILTSIKNGKAKKAPLIKVMADMENIQHSTAIPLATIVETSHKVNANKDNRESESQDEEVLSFKHTAVFKDRRYLAILDQNQTTGIKWLTNDIDTAYFSVNIHNAPVGINISKAKTTLKPSIIEGKVVIKADIKVNASVMGNIDSRKIEEKYTEDFIVQEVKNKILNQCESAQEALLREYKVDVLNIEKLLKHHQRHYYLENRENFEEILENTHYDINVECNLKIQK